MGKHNAGAGWTGAVSSRRSTRHTRALIHARNGWPVFPVWPIGPDGHCTCQQGAGCKAPKPGKHPLTCKSCGLTVGGHKNATTDPATIARWWTHHPAANIGGATGHRFNVIDVDPRHGGYLEPTGNGGHFLVCCRQDHRHTPESCSFDDLVAELPQTRVHRTGGGGWHVILSGDHRRGHAIAGTAIELKADGGYVLLPGSNHADGGAYSVVDRSPVVPFHVPSAFPDRNRSDAGRVVSTGTKAPSAHRSGNAKPKTKSQILDQIDAVVTQRAAQPPRNGEVRFLCPVHADHPRPSASWNRVKEVWRCWSPSCGAGGSWRDLARRLGIDIGPSTAEWLAATRHAAMTFPWPRGISGLIRRRVLLAILADAHHRVWSGSDRKLARLAGVGLQTAYKHRAALMRTGWLKRKRIGRGSVESQYLLLRPPARKKREGHTWNISSLREGGQSVMFQVCHTPSDDRWRHRGLGESARLVRGMLDAGVTHPGAIARALSMHPRTVRRALVRLAAPEPRIQRASGTGARQQRLYDRQRADFATRLVHRKLKRWPMGCELTNLQEETGLNLAAVALALTHPSLAPYVEQPRPGWLRLRRDVQIKLTGKGWLKTTRPKPTRQERAGATITGVDGPP